jgi:tetratricopeptide (TPR) repeat protein
VNDFKTLHLILPIILTFLPQRAMAVREFAAWEEFDSKAPLCERPIALGVGRESFFEISNDVEGREGFNRIVEELHSSNWQGFDIQVEAFRQAHEKSPLREAVTFIEVQSLYDRSNGRSDESEKKAERAHRSAVLLYPQSEFIPVLAATSGAYWLRTNSYQRSLASYEVALATFPDHPLACTFRMGIAEAQFLLRDWKSAEKAIENTLTLCRNFRLRSAAFVRKNDIDWMLSKPRIEESFAKLMVDESPFIERLYQPAMANFGEVLYQAGKLTESTYFLERYIKKEKRESPCIAYAQKRLADIAARSRKVTSEVIGKYLSVYENFPKTEVGRFSYAHALLADPSLEGGAELARRIKIADEQSAAIQDEGLRTRIFLEKAITLLEFGQVDSFDLLVNMRDKTSFPVTQGKTGLFIRKKMGELFESGKVQSLDSPLLFGSLEQAYRNWFKGTEKENWIHQFYSRSLTKQVSAAVSSDRFQDALSLLTHWQKSVLWPSEGAPREARLQIGKALLSRLYLQPGDGSFGLEVASHSSILSPFIEPEYAVVVWLARIQLGNQGAGRRLKWERQLAQASGSIPQEDLGLFRLATASGLRRIGDLSGAESALAKVSGASLKSSVRAERLALAVAMRKPDRAFILMKEALLEVPDAEKADAVSKMKDFSTQEKLWSRGPEIESLARSIFSKGTDLVPYLLFSARAHFELKECEKSVRLYETAFESGVPTPLMPESRFRFGKCLVQQKKKELARLELQKVIDSKDLFWSSLAQSELSLIDP